MTDYSLLPKIVLRSPLLPLEGIMGGNCFKTEELKSLLKSELIQEAIYLASPSLYAELQRWMLGDTSEKESKKIELTLVRYLSRMSSRGTPFGIFASISLARWSDKTKLLFSSGKGSGKHTRLDMDFLIDLAHRIGNDPVIKHILLYYPNNTIYEHHNELRFIEARSFASHRRYEISCVENTSQVMQVLEFSKKGVTIKEAASILVSEEVSLENALEFIEEMIEGQLLMNNFLPGLTGSEFLEQIINQLNRLQKTNGDNESLKFYLELLHEIKCDLIALDSTLGTPSSVYQEIEQKLQKFKVPINNAHLFQVDFTREYEAGEVDSKFAGKIRRTLEFLTSILPVRETQHFSQFKEAFAKRYELQEIPLLQALDNESGIGYIQNRDGDFAPLVDDIFFPSERKENGSQMSEFLKVVYDKLTAPASLGSTEITLVKSDFNEHVVARLPDTFSVMGIFFESGDSETKESMFLNHLSTGASASNLLARFTHSDKEIEDFCNEISDVENELNSNSIVAEVVYLPEARVGNITTRKLARKYEIPILTNPSVTDEFRIDLQDLLISVNQDGRVVLRSIKHNKEVIPKLSTAHAFWENSLPIYHFLCDLQSQGTPNLPPIEKIQFKTNGIFRPRIKFESVILSRATWVFQSKDTRNLLQGTFEESKRSIKSWRAFWNLPRFIHLLERNDFELFIDFDNDVFIDLFLIEIRREKEIKLVECLHRPSSSIVRDREGNSYATEFVVSFARKSKKQQALPKVSNKISLQRKFPPGSQWVYLKIYLGHRTSDDILVNIVAPMLEGLLRNKIIDGWFFIRYYDPDYHLRIRLRLVSLENAGHVFTLIYGELDKYVNSNVIRNLQFDTYVRELERYGEMIPVVEDIFFFQSNLTVRFLKLASARENYEILRLLFMLKSIDSLLAYFDFSDQRRLEYYSFSRQGFSREFKSNKITHKQLGVKYKTYQKTIEQLFSENEGLPEGWDEIRSLFSVDQENFINKVRAIKEYYGLKPDEDLNSIIWSICHMAINRVARSKPRNHEFLVYDLLERYYNSKLNRDHHKANQND